MTAPDPRTIWTGPLPNGAMACPSCMADHGSVGAERTCVASEIARLRGLVPDATRVEALVAERDAAVARAASERERADRLERAAPERSLRLRGVPVAEEVAST